MDLAMRTLHIPITGGFGIGRRRGGVTPDPDRMLLIEMREDWVEKLPLGYNAIEQDEFWARHQDIVAARLVQLVNTSGELVLSVAWDSAHGELKCNERQHVQTLRRVFTSLGPAFVKMGQGLASRPDLFSPESVDELARLFCAVPPFPTSEAMRVITRELGAPWWEFFVDLGEYPAAAASLGQVYR
jgi:predicted unusual protein kinase regulating ubiquinone biosynthesis (AarF/ABC1/UbiB family)